MIPVGSLIWSLLAALLVTAFSLFYTQNGGNGYPFSVTYLEKETIDEHGESLDQEASSTDSAQVSSEKVKKMSWITFGADVFFWWIIFSILLVVVKNYIFDSYQEKPRHENRKTHEQSNSKYEKEDN